MAGQQVATATVYLQLDQQMLEYRELIIICLFCNYTLNAGPEATILDSGPAPAILEWYGHCFRISEQARGLGACSPRKIRHSEVASEAMFGPKKLLESPHL